MSQKTKIIRSFSTQKRIILTFFALVIFLAISGIVVANRTKTQIKELFKLNKELQEQNY